MLSPTNIIIALILILPISSIYAGERQYCLSYVHPNTGSTVTAMLSLSKNPLFPYVLSNPDKTYILIKTIVFQIIEGGFGDFHILMEAKDLPDKITGTVQSIVE